MHLFANPIINCEVVKAEQENTEKDFTMVKLLK